MMTLVARTLFPGHTPEQLAARTNNGKVGAVNRATLSWRVNLIKNSICFPLVVELLVSLSRKNSAKLVNRIIME